MPIVDPIRKIPQLRQELRTAITRGLTTPEFVAGIRDQVSRMAPEGRSFPDEVQRSLTFLRRDLELCEAAQSSASSSVNSGKPSFRVVAPQSEGEFHGQLGALREAIKGREITKSEALDAVETLRGFVGALGMQDGPAKQALFSSLDNLVKKAKNLPERSLESVGTNALQGNNGYQFGTAI